MIKSHFFNEIKIGQHSQNSGIILHTCNVENLQNTKLTPANSIFLCFVNKSGKFPKLPDIVCVWRGLKYANPYNTITIFIHG